MRRQLNVRLDERDASDVQSLLHMIAARLTLDTGELHTTGDALAAAVRQLGARLGLTDKPTKASRSR